MYLKSFITYLVCLLGLVSSKTISHPLTLYYWTGNGLAQNLRYMLIQEKVPYNEVLIRFEQSDMFKKFKASLIKSGYIFPDLPMLTDKSSSLYFLSHYQVIFEYLIQTYLKKLEAKDFMDRILSRQIQSQIMTLLSSLLAFIMDNRVGTKITCREIMGLHDFNLTFDTLNKLYSNSSTGYLFKKLTWIDIFVYSFLMHIELTDLGCISNNYPSLVLLANKISSLPNIYKYERTAHFSKILFAVNEGVYGRPINWSDV